MIFKCKSLSYVMGVVSSVLFMFFLVPMGFAQEDVGSNAAYIEEEFFSEEENIMIEARKEVLSSYETVALRPSIPSLLFLPGEHKLLQAAKSNFLTRIPSDEELNSIGENGENITSIRTVSLDGILYNGEKKWIIWVNNKRITADALPSEIIDLKVFGEYINIKWFDAQTNKVYPIRLRPNQTFNLDARMFLPG